ncbi:MAG TPA: M23 family metallopeptidase [Candidatus Goldiibacteriota bacterium]|nr:M23 family metallopeptidase [Candidatus Goldiibacteriota bacterium]
MKEIIEQLKEQSKNICIKRIVVLFGFMLFVVSISFLSVLVSAKQSAALASMKAESLENLLKEKGQNLDALYSDKFSDVCKRDKELGYIYLRKKLLAKNLGVALHRVEMGENYWTIAKKYNVNIDTIIGANPELENLLARKGSEIIVLSKRGVIHEVKDKAENLNLLAELYRIDEASIKATNRIPLQGIKEGDLLFIPGAKPVYMHENLQKLFAKRSMFRSPLSGVYTSLYGTRIHPVTGEKHGHNAVDIRAKMGTWVGASADGTVVFAGWSDTLGYYVKIQHKDGYMTLYGHLSKIYVKPWQKVFAGKLIAKTGNSGRTTGPHLHFAVFKDGRAVNPMDFLW